MTKWHTPTPWRLDECCYGDNIIEGPNDEIIMWDTPAHKITPTVNDMRHIVKCVNMHDELLANLKYIYKQWPDTSAGKHARATLKKAEARRSRAKAL